MIKVNISYSKSKRVRDKIEPFGGWSPDQKRFWVSWRQQPLTFQQIMEDIGSRIENDLVHFQKIERQYIPDLLQQGWLRLWQALYEDENLLVSMPRIKVVDFVANRCGAFAFKSYLRRYARYHDFKAWEESETDAYEDSITEIVIGSSLKSSGKPGHALFTRIIDRIIDIANAIRQVADWCKEDIRKLAALYYVTTDVSQCDAGRIAGLPVHTRKHRNPHCPAMRRWSKMVLEKLREVLHDYLPIEPNRHFWKDEIKAGNVEPIVELAQKFTEDRNKLLALYSLTARVPRKTLVKELGIDGSKLWYAIKVVRKELRHI